MDGNIDHAGACCGACAFAAEVARNGGPELNTNGHLHVALDENGVPRDVTVYVQRRGRTLAHEIRVEKSRLIFGRSAAADVVIDDAGFSRRHFSLDFSSGEIVVEDLDSTCGTYVNGAKVRRVALRDRDEINGANQRIWLRVG